MNPPDERAQEKIRREGSCENCSATAGDEMKTGCTTTVQSIEWPYKERVEDVVNDVLRDACPPWRVSITASPSRSTWVVVAQPGGDAAFSALLTPGLHTPQHVRGVLREFYKGSKRTCQPVAVASAAGAAAPAQKRRSSR
jgi:hypothetical protein